MNQMQAYWLSVRERERELIADGHGEFVWMVSIETARRTTYAGRVTHVDRYNAAILLVRGTHRLASEEEIAAHQRAEEQRREENADFEARREGRIVVPRPDVIGAKKNG